MSGSVFCFLNENFKYNYIGHTILHVCQSSLLDIEPMKRLSLSDGQVELLLTVIVLRV